MHHKFSIIRLAVFYFIKISDFLGTAPGAGAMKSSGLPVQVQSRFVPTGQKKRAARKRKTAQQQIVSSLQKQGKINYVFVQPATDYGKQMQPVFLPASASTQTGNQGFIATSIQHQDLKDDTAKWGCSSPETFPTANAQGMAKMPSLGSVGPNQHVQNWQIAPQQVFSPVVQHSLSRQIAHTVTTPTALPRNLSTPMAAMQESSQHYFLPGRVVDQKGNLSIADPGKRPAGPLVSLENSSQHFLPVEQNNSFSLSVIDASKTATELHHAQEVMLLPGATQQQHSACRSNSQAFLTRKAREVHSPVSLAVSTLQVFVEIHYNSLLCFDYYL